MSVAMAPSHTAAIATPPRHVSPLNPSSRNTVRTTTSGTATASTCGTKIHISNLDKLLLKHSQPKTEQNPIAPNMDVKEEPQTQNHHEKTPYLLNALNLPSLFPFLRKPAVSNEMSPRSLTYLQRVLSDSSRPSPKNSIASRWHMYHGQSNWYGLLDPLDENLRRELIRYGDFVQSAYHAFHSMPKSPSKNRHMILPDRSYRTTCSLHATSSVTLPEWAHRPGTPDWLTQRSSWIGYVAVCDSEREIARMGRRDITIVLRGTATCHEWYENCRASLTPLSDGEDETQQPNDNAHVPKVARGFLSLYKSSTDEVASLSNSVITEVKRLMEVYKGEELSITVVGHSLGAALALLVADEVSTCAPHVPPVAVVSFGGPKVGNRAFVERLQNRKVKVLRVVNEGDVITRVPGIEIARRGRTSEGYEHVGVELRVDSRASPCLRSDAGPACSHDLEAYLHLVDGFTGTGHPFRPDARRSIARLLQYQRTSVKEVYVNRARALGVDPTAAVLNRAESFGCVPSPSYR